MGRLVWFRAVLVFLELVFPGVDLVNQVGVISGRTTGFGAWSYCFIIPMFRRPKATRIPITYSTHSITKFLSSNVKFRLPNSKCLTQREKFTLSNAFGIDSPAHILAFISLSHAAAPETSSFLLDILCLLVTRRRLLQVISFAWSRILLKFMHSAVVVFVQGHWVNQLLV